MLAFPLELEPGCRGPCDMWTFPSLPFPSLMWGLDTLLQHKRETVLSKGLPLPWMLTDPVHDP